MSDTNCKNYFKSDGKRSGVQAYTDLWIRLIDELECAKANLPDGH